MTESRQVGLAHRGVHTYTSRLVDPAARTAIGRTGVEVTQLSLGCGPFGGMWAPVPDGDAVATVRGAFDAGVRYFDTAPLYGVGQSERRLGLGLRDLPRDQLTVSTKVGRVLQDDDGTIPPTFEYTPDAVRRSLDGSRTRTGLDRFDIVHVHDPERHVEAAIDGAFPTLRAMQAAGEIGAVSCGTNFSEPLVRFIGEGLVDCVLISGQWTLLDQSALDELLPLAHERGVAVIAASVFNSGILADPDADLAFVNYKYRPPTPEILDKTHRIRDICASHGVPLKAAAIQFPLSHPAVGSVLLGCRSPEEVASNAADLATDIPTALWADLATAGLIRPDAVRTTG
jgi:aryl-alcohol dehydrogenase-like predicted oxidoreductase